MGRQNQEGKKNNFRNGSLVREFDSHNEIQPACEEFPFSDTGWNSLTVQMRRKLFASTKLFHCRRPNLRPMAQFGKLPRRDQLNAIGIMDLYCSSMNIQQFWSSSFLNINSNSRIRAGFYSRERLLTQRRECYTLSITLLSLHSHNSADSVFWWEPAGKWRGCLHLVAVTGFSLRTNQKRTAITDRQ